MAIRSPSTKSWNSCKSPERVEKARGEKHNGSCVQSVVFFDGKPEDMVLVDVKSDEVELFLVFKGRKPFERLIVDFDPDHPSVVDLRVVGSQEIHVDVLIFHDGLRIEFCDQGRHAR